MATMKVHGSTLSTAAQRVLACLNEKELGFEFVEVDMRSESRAITQYISHSKADKGSQLVFEDPKKMAILGVWMEVEAHQFDPPASKLLWELGVKPMLGMTTDAAVVEANEANLGKVLEVYEARLAESKYIGGESFTLADLNHLPVLQFLMGVTQVKKLFDSRPHVSAWCADILSRPAWLKVVAMKTNN